MRANENQRHMRSAQPQSSSFFFVVCGGPAFFPLRFLLFKREQGPAALAAKSNGVVCHERRHTALGVPM
jgi:hypothetical protein